MRQSELFSEFERVAANDDVEPSLRQQRKDAVSRLQEAIANLEVDLAIVSGERSKLNDQVVILREVAETIAEETAMPCRSYPDCSHDACGMVTRYREMSRQSVEDVKTISGGAKQ